jgi:hypothetical protein
LDVLEENRKNIFKDRPRLDAENSHSDRFSTISFARVQFLGEADFSGREFKGPADFTFARFGEPPRFDSLTNVDLCNAKIAPAQSPAGRHAAKSPFNFATSEN